MRSRESGVPPSACPDPARITWSERRHRFRFLSDTATIVDVEMRKLRHDPADVITRSIQPMLWLVVFGSVISRSRTIPTDGKPYFDFLAPGVVCQSALFVSIFFGMAIIWERDLGVVHKFLVSPAARSSLVVGKALSAGLRVLPQSVVIYLVSATLGVNLRIELLPVLGVALAVIIGSGIFATFSLIIACLVKTRERFMGIGQLLTMPLFFASNAIYPISLMPAWLGVVARGNPLTYQVDAVRTLMLHDQTSGVGLATDFAVMTATLVFVVVVAARLYPRVAI